MPKQKLGSGNKRAVLQRPATSYTSPNAIKLQQRRAAALDYRLQGHAYHRIAKALGCHPSTAHDYVVKALRDTIPREKAEAVLTRGLTAIGRINLSLTAICCSTSSDPSSGAITVSSPGIGKTLFFMSKLDIHFTTL
jgi:hypothetical protein